MPLSENSTQLPEKADCISKIAQLNESRSLPSQSEKYAAKLTGYALDTNTLQSDISLEYLRLWNEFSDAMEALSSSNNKIMYTSTKYSATREKEQPKYIDKLKNFIAAGVEYTKKREDIKARSARVFSEDNVKYLSDALNAYKVALQNCGVTTPLITDTVSCISSYLDFLSEVYKPTAQLENFKEKAYNLTEQLHTSLVATHPNVDQVVSLKNFNAVILATHRVCEFIGMAWSKVDNLRDVLHNIENVLIASRMRVLLNSDQSVIELYLKINQDLLNLQITLLEFAVTTSMQQITMWPVLNRDLMRIQIKEPPIAATILLGLKRQDLLVFNSGFAGELSKIFEVLNESDKIRIEIVVNKTTISEAHKESMKKPYYPRLRLLARIRAAFRELFKLRIEQCQSLPI